MDSFAAYKTNSSVIESVIDEAKECCNAADMRNDVYENHGQVRCTRELLFASEESELRTCLNIVAANETDSSSLSRIRCRNCSFVPISLYRWNIWT